MTKRGGKNRPNNTVSQTSSVARGSISKSSKKKSTAGTPGSKVRSSSAPGRRGAPVNRRAVNVNLNGNDSEPEPTPLTLDARFAALQPGPIHEKGNHTQQLSVAEAQESGSTRRRRMKSGGGKQGKLRAGRGVQKPQRLRRRERVTQQAQTLLMSAPAAGTDKVSSKKRQRKLRRAGKVK